MQIPVLVEWKPESSDVVARCGEPFNMTVEAANPAEALCKLEAAIRARLEAGAAVYMIDVPEALPAKLDGGAYKDEDPIRKEWRAEVEAYRRECDAHPLPWAASDHPGQP